MNRMYKVPLIILLTLVLIGLCYIGWRSWKPPKTANNKPTTAKKVTKPTKTDGTKKPPELAKADPSKTAKKLETKPLDPPSMTEKPLVDPAKAKPANAKSEEVKPAQPQPKEIKPVEDKPVQPVIPPLPEVNPVEPKVDPPKMAEPAADEPAEFAQWWRRGNWSIARWPSRASSNTASRGSARRNF